MIQTTPSDGRHGRGGHDRFEPLSDLVISSSRRKSYSPHLFHGSEYLAKVLPGVLLQALTTRP